MVERVLHEYLGMAVGNHRLSLLVAIACYLGSLLVVANARRQGQPLWDLMSLSFRLGQEEDADHERHRRHADREPGRARVDARR